MRFREGGCFPRNQSEYHPMTRDLNDITWTKAKHTHLNISLRLICNFHDELCLSVDHMFQDRLIDTILSREHDTLYAREILLTQHPSYPSLKQISIPFPPKEVGRARQTVKVRYTSHHGQEGTTSTCHHRQSSGTAKVSL